MYLADPMGFHRLLEADLEHEGVVHTVISAGNSIAVTGSQSASIQVGRKEGWATSHSEASLTNQLTEHAPDPEKESFVRGGGRNCNTTIKGMISKSRLFHQQAAVIWI